MTSRANINRNEMLCKLQLIQEKVLKLLCNTAEKLRSERPNSLNAMERYFRVAEYLLAEAEEYVMASWEELKADRPRASLAVSRWVLEASFNLCWVGEGGADCGNRLKYLVAEAFHRESIQVEGMAKLSTDKETQNRWIEQARPIREEGLKLKKEVEEKNEYKTLASRIESLRKTYNDKNCPDPYAIYRICCGAAHPRFDVWWRFQMAPGGATVTKDRLTVKMMLVLSPQLLCIIW